MACFKCFLLVVVVLLGVSSATARRLQQAATAAAAAEQTLQLAQQAPVQIGDGSERILSRAAIKRQGGALKALGRSALQKLRSNARYQGTVLSLAQVIDKDADLVGICFVRRAAWSSWLGGIRIIVLPLPQILSRSVVLA